MISVVFPDGREQQYEKGVAVLDVVNSISTTLTKKTVCALVNGKVVDLQSKLEEDCNIKFLTLDTKDANEKKEILHVMRHSCAHLFAQAMRELYGNKVRFAFGPATETGFYYDFELTDGTKITTEDFPKIEKKMHELAEKKFEVVRKKTTKNKAIEFFGRQGEKYKVELLGEKLDEKCVKFLTIIISNIERFKNENKDILEKYNYVIKNPSMTDEDINNFCIKDITLKPFKNYLVSFDELFKIFDFTGEDVNNVDLRNKIIKVFDCITYFFDKKINNINYSLLLLDWIDFEDKKNHYYGDFNQNTWKYNYEKFLNPKNDELIGRRIKTCDFDFELIKIKLNDQHITTYTQGSFTDLCRGPHVMNTGFLKHFKLMKVSGAYWRADAKNAMLQRVYGTCWSTKEELDNYLKMLEEAEKRDHRKLGQQLDLFHLQEEAPGCAFWHPRGWTLYLLLQNYIREKIKKHGYIEVKTPQIVSKTLWEKSGHWTKYREHMFITRIDEENMDFAIKPMNCPCHVEIFKNKIRSYKDLPIRMAEFGKCHRYEPSGSLHGLMRVRGFVQDDAHIFCTEEQIAGETIAFYKLLKEVYSDFGFDNIKVKFSDRPEMRVGSDELWDKAEKALREPMEQAGVELELNKGEGAFYGPKLEFVLKDAIGREWQCGTFQVDFNLGQRLGAEYVDEDGSKKPPVMLHRAVLGSFERFIAILIEHFAGAFPVWLAPVQAVVIGVNNELDGEVLKIVKKLQDAGIRCEADLSKETVSYKVRRQSEMKIPYIITIGNREVEDGTLSVRKFGEMKNETVEVDEFLKNFGHNISRK